MTTGAPQETVTALLLRWRAGRPEDQQRLFAAVQEELRRIAAAYMRRERPDHTLQPTALVNEAYVRLVNDRAVAWENRAHFYGIAARAMRQILVSYARKHNAGKRGAGGRAAESVSRIPDPAGAVDVDVLALHEALDGLAAIDPRQAEIVELRYFGGLTEEQVAQIKGLSPATIRREVAAARFWLGHRMRGGR
jgi:RNA polymerase sigma factor (TIGR02999 family)